MTPSCRIRRSIVRYNMIRKPRMGDGGRRHDLRDSREVRKRDQSGNARLHAENTPASQAGSIQLRGWSRELFRMVPAPTPSLAFLICKSSRRTHWNKNPASRGHDANSGQHLY